MRQGYTLAEVAGLLQVDARRARSLATLVHGEPRDAYSFQDLVLFRTARGLLERKVPRRRIAAALARMREELPAGQPLSAVALQQVGREIVVGVGAARWSAASGQELFDFGRAPPAATWLKPPATGDAEAHYARGSSLAAADPAAAFDAFSEAIAANPHHADAHLALGRLLTGRGRHREAEAHFVATLVCRPTDLAATVALGEGLEAQGRLDAAIERFREALELDSRNVDACFGLSRVYEAKARAQGRVHTLAKPQPG